MSIWFRIPDGNRKNNMVMKNNLLLISLIAILLVGCNEDELKPMSHNATPPGQVTNIQVENLPGKAKLTYTLPNDPDLLYVKAVYQLNSGVMREIKASYYTNTMTLDGFGDTNVHEVQVYAVNRSEVASEPVSIKVQPEENPIWGVRRSLVISDDFSGVNIKAENPTRETVAIEIMYKDSLGTWQTLESFESSLPKIETARRGLDTLEYEFRFTVRDRFLNYTDTLYATVHPLFEQMLDKSQFKAYNLPGDARPEQPGWLEMDRMWNNIYTYTNHERWLIATPSDVHSPQISTFDIGTPAKLSRLTLFNWGYENSTSGAGDRLFYTGEHMRRFEIWGTMTPDPDGSLDSWTLLATFENEKPSQLPYGQQSQEDFDTAISGFDFVFPVSSEIPKVRYVRIRNLESWDGTTKFGIEEIDLYGDPR